MNGITELERARRSREERGGCINMVNSDFRAAGLLFPEQFYREAWDRWRADPACPPTGRGSPEARRAVAAFLSGDGLETRAEELILTAGSSISYSLLFAFLKGRRERSGGALGGGAGGNPEGAPAPGDGTIALPRPGYPLFEELVHAAGLSPLWYTLDPAGGFIPDPPAVRAVLEQNPLALVLVSPNNPSGAVYGREVLKNLLLLCSERGIPIISDEVFSSFRGDSGQDRSLLPRPAALLDRNGKAGGGSSRIPLVFSLNGLSKLCAAPEVKLGWIAVHGSTEAVREAVETLDTLHDTYLTLSGFAGKAAEIFLSPAAASARGELARRVDTMRCALLEGLLQVKGLSVPGGNPAAAGGGSGGIHRIVQLDGNLCAERFGTLDDERIARKLVSEQGVYLHPGYLYGLDRSVTGTADPFFVITCLHAPHVLEECLRRLTQALRG
ncbi:MAG: pyridoxal phosphate-dependent aminotransferase [Spirochaetaceae bacterium]|nr:MAG: pyridoxal phosphate-dependent aminotransferase [Spirochaetaceae bacterium]